VHDEIEPFEGMELFKSSAAVRREKLAKSKSPMITKEKVKSSISVKSPIYEANS
jgi:hypothetical protein